MRHAVAPCFAAILGAIVALTWAAREHDARLDRLDRTPTTVVVIEAEPELSGVRCEPVDTAIRCTPITKP